MKYPDFKEERKLWQKGYKKIAGLDEAGRGPLAGPVVACALLVNQRRLIFRVRISLHQSRFSLTQIRDSKKLTPKRREKLYKTLIKHPAIEWGIGRASEKVIDRINILEATKLAMKRAILNLEKKMREVRPQSCPKTIKGLVEASFRPIDHLILDGKMSLDLEIPQKSIVKADEKVFSCAAASIIAKVSRDRLMKKYHKKYPSYGFNKHKGYPTKFHRKILKKLGFCKIHRKTFKLLTF